MNETKTMPLVALRGLTVFPYMALHFDIGRVKSIKALERAMFEDQEIMLCTQKDLQTENPESDDIYKIGTVSRIKQILKLPGDIIRVLVEGQTRAAINSIIQSEPFLEAEVIIFNEDSHPTSLETQALMRMLLNELDKYAKTADRITSETRLNLQSISNPSHFADIVAANILREQNERQEILECIDVDKRLEKLYSMLVKETELAEIEQQIQSRVRSQIDKSQKEYYLREQIKAISKELGENENENEELRSRIEGAGLPEEVKQKADKELSRLVKTPSNSPEYSMIRAYIDWILELPWTKESIDNNDFSKTAKILDDEHYGLEKVKERILEYLAVCCLKQNMKSPILCFVGPPGVGKTSIATSIAHALGRSFVRMSLGGVHDEAEIRGHRRTYIGAIPGRIINGMRQAKTVNPVFLLDEIDKMGNDFRGDPASAMLEVLDSNQNNTFRDHYLELPYDLSKVMFIATANTADTIPRPLLDRMEVITIPGYTEQEKAEIAKRHLIPKQMSEHGIKKKALSIPPAVIHDIINYYTRESGVRSLERQIASICRKAARKLVDSDETVRVNRKNLSEFLGVQRYHYDKAGSSDEVGLATGLAWTSVGGETLNIEVATMPGTGELRLTGQLGDVMKESAKTAFSLIRSKCKEWSINPDFYKELDIHIHIPEGAIPKDGPSAGITLTTAMVSALTGIPVLNHVAMTGEITLRGKVLPIGGLKEKTLAAHRAGIKTVIIPKENEKDLADIPESIREKLHFVLADSIETVLETALIKSPRSK